MEAQNVRPARTRKPRWVRISLWTIGILLLIPVLLWLGGAAYVYTHQNELREQILTQLNENLNGKLEMERMEPTLVGDFPNVSLALHNVRLRDTLWERHHRDLLSMKRIYVKISPWSLLGSDGPLIHRVRLADGIFDLFTDSSGYSNGYVLKSNKPDPGNKERRQGPSIRAALVENVRFVMEDIPKDKAFRVHIRSLNLTAKDKGDVEALHVKTEIHIGQLGFNLDRGSFAKNKTMKANLDINFNTVTRTIEVPMQELDFNGDEIDMEAKFYIGPENKRYDVHFVAPEIRVDTGASFLAENVTKMINLVSLKDPVEVDVRIGGGFSERNPKVHAAFKTEDNVLTTPVGKFEECSFAGFYDNELVKGTDRTDPNSTIEIDGFKGIYKGIPLNADTIAITNLKVPKLLALIHSKFDATAVNNLTGGKTFKLTKGSADFRLRYFGSLSLIDNTIPQLDGAVNIRNAEGTYVPRRLPLSGINAQLVFRGVDVQIPRVAFRTGSSSVVMSGLAQNLLAAMHNASMPASLRWSVSSSLINLADFLPFLQKREGAAPAQRPDGGIDPNSPMADRLDDALDAADASLTANIQRVQYKNFRADAVQAAVLLTRTQVQLQRASLRHADGTIQLAGEAEQGSGGNNFTATANVRRVNIEQLFNTFENFGQDAVTAQNVKGRVSFDANMKGRISPDGGLVTNSLFGDLSLNLEDAALNGFAPLEKVGRFVFRKRNLSAISIPTMDAKFHLRGDRIIIEPMAVESSALTIKLHGIYGLKSGTDISVQIPIRNPKKDSADIAEGAMKERGERGMTFHILARNPTGKKLDIGWDRGGKIYRQRLGEKESSGEPLQVETDDALDTAATRPSGEKRSRLRRVFRGKKSE